MRMHVLKIWNERLHNEGGVFEPVRHKEGEEKCMIDSENITEFLEALEVDDYVEESDVLILIEELS